MKTDFPPAIIAVGRNYAEHAAEMGRDVAEHPVIFMKNPACIIKSGEPIIIPDVCDFPHEQVDYEGELAVIIGRNARDVPEQEVFDYIEGYAVANDVTAR